MTSGALATTTFGMALNQNPQPGSGQESVAGEESQQQQQQQHLPLANATTTTSGAVMSATSSTIPQTASSATSMPVPAQNLSSGPTNLSGLVCNVHRTTGREPHSLVGATITILGDKLYVFGG